MTREQAEENYRIKFDEYGLSDSFEFIKREWSVDHDKRFWSRCKSCGSVFLSWNEVFRGRQGRLICPQCGIASDGSVVWHRSEHCEQAMKYYVAGHSVRETAEKFGVTTAQINNAVKVRGITNGRDFRAEGRKHTVENQKKKAIEHLADRLNKFGFDYVGGYTDHHGTVQYRCRKCGKLIEHTVAHVRSGNIVCHQCEHEDALIRQEHRRMQARADAEKKRAEKEENKLRAEAEKAEALFYLMNDKTHVCSVCGKHFSRAEFMESKGLKLIPTNPKYCSKECSRKAMNMAKKNTPSGRTGNYYVRARKYGCEYVAGITLKKLIKRDGLRCAICGEMCDPDDRSWSEYSGPTYPSIDHIIPMSKGGGHTWDNVQVAHIICNSEKGDKVAI